MCGSIVVHIALVEMNTLNPPVKPGIDNTGVITGSSVSLLLVVITLIMVITITTVVYCKR